MKKYSADRQSLTQKNVYIIIPVHNRKKITLACLDNLKNIGVLEKYSVIVIDDGSEDGTGDAITSMYPTVSLEKGTGNLWWTGAIRRGMEKAADLNADYIFWLNDDCHLSEETLPTLIEFMQKHPNMIAAPRCVAENSNLTIENGCIGRIRATANHNEITFVDSLSGYCVGIPKSVFESIGFPNEKRFPHYSGDDTYILKATKKKFRACIVGNSEIILKNFSETEHGFQNYLRNRFSIFPTIHDIFFHKKSRYFLYSQFYYHLEKYQFAKGITFFSIKSILWIIEYCWLYLIYHKNHESFNRS